MGLFDKKTKEEKVQAKEEKTKQKAEAKEANKAEKEAFKQLIKDRGIKKIVTLSVLNDSADIVVPSSAITLYVLSDTIIFKWLQAGYFSSHYVMDEYNFIDVEWIDDIRNKGKKVVGRSIAGAMIAGPAGMIIGGVTGKDKVKDKSIAVITLQNKETHEVRMISFYCTKMELVKYRTIQKSPLIEDEKVVQVEAVGAPVVDSLDQLKKLKELLDLEAITQSEYDTKKAELLQSI